MSCNFKKENKYTYDLHALNTVMDMISNKIDERFKPKNVLVSDLNLFLCIRFIYETESFNGVGELLEILGR